MTFNQTDQTPNCEVYITTAHKLLSFIVWIVHYTHSVIQLTGNSLCAGSLCQKKFSVINVHYHSQIYQLQ